MLVALLADGDASRRDVQRRDRERNLAGKGHEGGRWRPRSVYLDRDSVTPVIEDRVQLVLRWCFVERALSDDVRKCSEFPSVVSASVS